MSFKILIAEDDIALQKLISNMIKKQGYIPVVASDGKEALELFDETISLCILDIMMPYYNGWEVLTAIKNKSNVPAMMLTALGDESNEVLGLRSGADDYLAKPFSYPIFIARVKNLLKSNNTNNKEREVIGDISFCRELREVIVGDEKLELNNKEYLLLEYFISNINLVLTRENILRSIWGYDYDGDIRTVDAHVKMLRKKLSGSESEYIKTVRGSGYKFSF